MTVTLTPELEQLIQHMVSTGRYSSAGEVVGEALHLLRQRDSFREMQLEELRHEIQLGREAADRGELVDGSEVFRRLRELQAQVEARADGSA